MEFDKLSAKIFLINKKGKILLQLRDEKPNIFYPGYWGLLGGGADKGELAFEAIKREINEEIGTNIQDIEEIGKVDLFLEEEINYRIFPIDDLKNPLDEIKLEAKIHERIVLFKGRFDVPIDKINLTEGQKVEFFDIAHVLDLNIPPYLRKFINENKEKLI